MANSDVTAGALDAGVAQPALAAGVIDELARGRVLEGEDGVTHMRYRVRR